MCHICTSLVVTFPFYFHTVFYSMLFLSFVCPLVVFFLSLVLSIVIFWHILVYIGVFWGYGGVIWIWMGKWVFHVWKSLPLMMANVSSHELCLHFKYKPWCVFMLTQNTWTKIFQLWSKTTPLPALCVFSAPFQTSTNLSQILFSFIRPQISKCSNCSHLQRCFSCCLCCRKGFLRSLLSIYWRCCLHSK